jgi:DNA-binding response OmpR family regulator
VELSAREFTMLEVFLRHAGQVLAREQLLSHLWRPVRGMGYALEV